MVSWSCSLSFELMCVEVGVLRSVFVKVMFRLLRRVVLGHF